MTCKICEKTIPDGFLIEIQKLPCFACDKCIKLIDFDDEGNINQSVREIRQKLS